MRIRAAAAAFIPLAARQPLEEYLAHVRVFRDGSILAAGWRRSSRELLADAAPAERRLLQPRPACLGQILSAEWAKDNGVGRIDSGRLLRWSREIRAARADGSLRRSVDRLLHEAEAALSRPFARREAEYSPGRLGFRRPL